MPPKQTQPTRISRGAGMTAGLEMWRMGDRIVLYDRSPAGTFAADVATWNAGLNAATTKKLKDAAQQDSA